MGNAVVGAGLTSQEITHRQIIPPSGLFPKPRTRGVELGRGVGQPVGMLAQGGCVSVMRLLGYIEGFISRLHGPNLAFGFLTPAPVASQVEIRGSQKGGRSLPLRKGTNVPLLLGGSCVLQCCIGCSTSLLAYLLQCSIALCCV